LKILRDLIARRLKVQVSTSSLSRLLRKLGLSPQVPLYQAYRKDLERANAYLTATLPEAVAKAKQLHAPMLFVAESCA
jgi:transposase